MNCGTQLGCALFMLAPAPSMFTSVAGERLSKRSAASHTNRMVRRMRAFRVGARGTLTLGSFVDLCPSRALNYTNGWARIPILRRSIPIVIVSFVNGAVPYHQISWDATYYSTPGKAEYPLIPAFLRIASGAGPQVFLSCGLILFGTFDGIIVHFPRHHLSG